MAIKLKEYTPQVPIAKAQRDSTINPEGAIELAGSTDALTADTFGQIGKIGQEFFKVKQEEKDKTDIAEYNLYATSKENELKVKQQEALANEGLEFSELGIAVNDPHKQEMQAYIDSQNYSPTVKEKIQLDLQGKFNKFDTTYQFDLVKREIEEDNLKKELSIGDLQGKIWALESEVIGLDESEIDPETLNSIEELKRQQAELVESLRRTAPVGTAEDVLSKNQYNRGLFILDGLKNEYINGSIDAVDFIDSMIETENRLLADPNMKPEHRDKLLTISQASIRSGKERVVRDRTAIIKTISTAMERGKASTEFMATMLEGQDPKVVEIINDAVLGKLQESAETSPEVAEAFEVVEEFINGETGFEEAMNAAAQVLSESSRELLIWTIADAAEDMATADPEGAYGTIFLQEGNEMKLNTTSAKFIRYTSKFLRQFRIAGTAQDRFAEKTYLADKIKSFQDWQDNPEGKSFEDWAADNFKEDALNVVTATAKERGYNDLVTPKTPPSFSPINKPKQTEVKKAAGDIVEVSATVDNADEAEVDTSKYDVITERNPFASKPLDILNFDGIDEDNNDPLNVLN